MKTLLLFLISINLFAYEIGDDFIVDKSLSRSDAKVFLVGKVKYLAIRLNTSNDNIALGATEFIGMKTGDDSGNTFGLDGKVVLEGEDGSIEMVASSNLFSHIFREKDYAPEKNKITYEQDFVEQNSLKLKLRILKNKLGGAYLILGGGLEQIKDREQVTASIQKWWHQTWGDTNFIQYKNLHQNFSQTNTTVNIGAGKEFQVGEETDSKMFLIAEGELEMNLNHSEESKLKSSLTFKIDSKELVDGLPSSSFKFAGNHVYRFDGVNEFDLSFEVSWVLFNLKSFAFVPHLGIGYSYTALDREYNDRGEVIFTLGFTAYIN